MGYAFENMNDEIAYGSLMESYNQLIIAKDLNYIDEEQLNEIQQQIDVVARMINGLRSSIKKKLDEINNKP